MLTKKASRCPNTLLPLSVQLCQRMPVTRSITRNHAAKTAPVVNLNLKRRASNKRQLEEEAESDPAPAAATKRAKKSSSSSQNGKVKPKVVEAAEAVPRPLVKPSGEDLAPLPAKLTFSLEDAKDHLIKADGRFGDVFSRLPCKPFERVEGIHPFRSVDFFRFVVSAHRIAGARLFLTMRASTQNAVHFHNVRGSASSSPLIFFLKKKSLFEVASRSLGRPLVPFSTSS